MVRKIVVIILATLVTCGFYFGSQLTVKQKLRRVPVAIATKDIPARTEITEDMVKEIMLPVSGIPPKIIRRKEDVVGKYTMSNFGIPQNGFFFSAVVKEKEELPAGGIMALKPGEELITMEVDLEKYLGGNAVPGTLINLWFVTRPMGREQVPVVGKIYENIRVLGARDRRAMEVSIDSPSEAAEKKKSSSSVAKVLLLAVPKEDVKYYFMAKSIGKVYPTGVKEITDPGEEAVMTENIEESRKWLEENVKILTVTQNDTGN